MDCDVVATGDPAGPDDRPARDEGADRDRLEQLVAGHPPADDREALAKARFLAELARLEHPFDEHADPVHVTASAVVVGPRGTVLHLHRRLGRWLQPGGHVDPGEAPEDAAVRESFEETGLHLTHPPGGPRLVHVDVHEAAGGHVHLDLRYLLAADGEPAPLPGESPVVRWFGWDEAEALADDALLGALRSVRALLQADPDLVGAVAEER
jgi:8-oxo-dGTP pyrophosphatase MutT (NUDIX family)